jgi:hypothetical protein
MLKLLKLYRLMRIEDCHRKVLCLSEVATLHCRYAADIAHLPQAPDFDNVIVTLIRKLYAGMHGILQRVDLHAASSTPMLKFSAPNAH